MFTHRLEHKGPPPSARPFAQPMTAPAGVAARQSRRER